MDKIFTYLSLLMGIVFLCMGIGLFILPNTVFADWSPGQRYIMGAVVLLYGGFRLWRARRMLLKNSPKENESSTIEKDEA